MVILPVSKFDNVIGITAFIFSKILPYLIRTVITIILTILFKTYWITIFYIISCAAYCIIGFIVNHLCLIFSKKKYDYAFCDTELVAFKMFYFVLTDTNNFNGTIDGLINGYVIQHKSSNTNNRN